MSMVILKYFYALWIFFLAFNASFSITGLLTPFSISTFTCLASSLYHRYLLFSQAFEYLDSSFYSFFSHSIPLSNLYSYLIHRLLAI